MKKGYPNETYLYQEYRYKRTPYVTIILVAINVVVFLLMEFMGSIDDVDYLYRWGATYTPAIFEEGQYYRLFTHMFLHSGFEHLAGNMFMLYILGERIEKDYGHIRYLITYIACGIISALVSSMYDMFIGEYPVGVGASGAIFGIFGVMLVMIFKNRRQMGQVSAPRLILLFILMVFGNMQEGVDWMAHLGGALTGVLIGFIFYKVKLDRRLEL